MFTLVNKCFLLDLHQILLITVLTTIFLSLVTVQYYLLDEKMLRFVFFIVLLKSGSEALYQNPCSPIQAEVCNQSKLFNVIIIGPITVQLLIVGPTTT